MSERLGEEHEQWIKAWNQELERLDRAADRTGVPPLAELEAMALASIERRGQRERRELLSFILLAVLVISMVLVAAWASAVLLLLIQGLGLLVGAAFLAGRYTGRKGSSYE
ncbi:DUF5345 family protein [Paenibacillus sp. JSM ZJ436]|uniref:DUF5345 family protein n=1 Tax=Paenibacillus sp. JSM ZJ436 TaxID=3376190 RepID=UPI0037AEB859